ncbi:MAG: thioredoxin domain-containing protein [Bacteroidota bacterium]
MSDSSLPANALIHESSPYLLQHAYNPVKWLPWSASAFEKAQLENKPVIISIGYSSCHWCHVMEHESFEDVTTAAIMNDNFISIKVDREERPDVDAIYMDAVQLMTGRGGWPLNCIVLPDQKPFYGGTYFTRSQWQQILLKVVELYKNDPDQCRKYAEELTAGISNLEQVYKSEDTAQFDFSSIYKFFETQFDKVDGGMNRVPKFPMPSNWEFLLHYYYHTADENCLKQIELTLQKMATGGIFDQLGGGFARYSTDGKWKIPHFEKMLYDNAQLVSLYSHAFRIQKNSIYKETVIATLEFIKREMTTPEGSFYSALDADSEGVEGKFYVWTEKELSSIIKEKNKKLIFFDYYKIRKDEIWEEEFYILQRIEDTKSVESKFNITTEQLDKIIEECKTLLWEERKKRIAPGLDDKQICSWNALMMKGYIDAYHSFKDEKLLDAAVKNASFIKTVLYNDGELYRTAKNNRANLKGYLDDYAFTINAITELYQCTGDEQHLQFALQLMKTAITYFADDDSGMFYYTSSNGEQLIMRKMEVQDNVINSSNAAMCRNLFLLSKITGNTDWREQAQRMVNNVKEHIEQSAPWYSCWAENALMMQNDFYEVVICGDKAMQYYQELASYYLPGCLLLFSVKPDENNLLFKGRFAEGKTGIYICSNNSCKKPVFSVKEALDLLSATKS